LRKQSEPLADHNLLAFDNAYLIF